MKRNLFLILIVTLISFRAPSQDQATPFTVADRDRIIKMEVKIDDMNKRFDDVDKRFDDVNKRIDQTRDDLNKRMDQTNTYMGWMIGLFGSLTLAIFGFAYWDRRTMIRPFETKVNEINIAIEQLKEEKTANKILTALRELSKKDTQLAEILKHYHLL